MDCSSKAGKLKPFVFLYNGKLEGKLEDVTAIQNAIFFVSRRNKRHQLNKAYSKKKISFPTANIYDVLKRNFKKIFRKKGMIFDFRQPPVLPCKTLLTYKRNSGSSP